MSAAASTKSDSPYHNQKWSNGSEGRIDDDKITSSLSENKLQKRITKASDTIIYELYTELLKRKI